MAIVNSIAVGQARKSAGNLTFQMIKGRTIAREKPIYVTNPQTPAQVAQRLKMTNLVTAWRGFFFRCKPYFTITPTYGSQYNRFVKENMPLGATSWLWAANNNWDLRTGTYVGYGKYSNAAMFGDFSDANHTFKVKVLDAQLQQDLLVGDKIIVMGDTDHTDMVEKTIIIETVLDAAKIATLQSGGLLSILSSNVNTPVNMAQLFYSPSRNISSTAIAHEPALAGYV